MSSDIPSINVTEDDSLSSCLDTQATSDLSFEEAVSFTNLSSEESLSTFSLKDIIKDEIDEISEDISKLSENHESLNNVDRDSPTITSYASQSPKTALKENRDGSPFKEALRGFVLSKLSKKSDSAHYTDSERKTLFSGIKEKIVKRLEESTVKDATQKEQAFVQQELDHYNDTILIVKKDGCELKSVVANEKFDGTSIEEAVECFEEKLTPTSTNGIFPDKTSGDSHLSPLVTQRSQTMSNISSATHTLKPKSSNERSISMTFSELQKTEEQENDENHLDVKARSSSVPEVISSTLRYDSCESVNSNFQLFEERTEDSRAEEMKTFSEKIKEVFILAKLSIWKCMRVEILVLVLAVLTYYFLNNWPFVCGFTCGIWIAMFFCLMYTEFTQSLLCDNATASYETLPPLPENAVLKKRTYIHGGWMNLLNGDYDPATFKLTDTVSVFVQVDIGTLLLSYPKKDVPKRAMWNEKKFHTNSFVREDSYSLFDARVMLLPEYLRQTREWNKRYPICIMLSTEEEIKQDTLTDVKEKLEEEPDASSKPPSNSSSQSGSLSSTPVHGPIKRSVFFLFSRTDREKEEWYWKLHFASKRDYLSLDVPVTTVKAEAVSSPEDSVSLSSPGSSKPHAKSNLTSIKENEETSKQSAPTKPILDFYHYMNLLITDALQTGSTEDLENNSHIQWLNVFLGRLTYDILVQKRWTDDTMLRIQKKLNRIKMPSYMQKLVVTDVYLGTSLPQIKKVSEAVLNDRGIWLDLDIDYQGYFQMTLETKFKTLRQTTFEKLQSTEVFGADESEAIAEELADNWDDDEDMPDSETSKEDSPLHHPPAVSAGEKILQSVGKWVNSGNLSENSFVKRYVGQFMQTRLLLTVEVDSVKGTLALNLPPRPSDRLWLGFRNNPKLSLNVFPKVGERQINLLPVIQLIKRKLIDEFQKAMVMPNMEDITIPIMHSTLHEQ